MGLRLFLCFDVACYIHIKEVDPLVLVPVYHPIPLYLKTTQKTAGWSKRVGDYTLFQQASAVQYFH